MTPILTFFRNVRAQATPAFKQVLAHVLIVFAVAFVGQLSVGLTSGVSVPTLLAVLIAGAAAGATAVVHYLLGLVPAPIRTGSFGAFYHVPKVVETKLLQVAVSVVATFAIMAGTAALAGATSVISLPAASDLIFAAITAGVTGAVQYLIGILPERIQTA